MEADLISPLPSPLSSPPRHTTASATAASAAASGYVTPPRSARRSSAAHTPPYSSRPLSYGPEAFSPPGSGSGMRGHHARAASVGGPLVYSSSSPANSPIDVRYLSRLVSPARDLAAAQPVRGSAKRGHARTFSFGLNGVTSESLLSMSPHSSSVRASPASPWSTTSSTSESESPLSMTPNLQALREVHAALDVSDRFIPSRRGSNLQHAAYGTLAEEDRSMQENVSSSGMAITFTNSSHPSAAASQAASAAAIGNSLGSNGAFSNAYGLLLRSEILGDKQGQSAGNTAVSACGEKQLVNAQLIMHRPGGASPVVGSAAAAASSPASSTSASSSSGSGSSHVKDSPRSPFPQTFRFSSPRAPSGPSEPNWSTSLSNSGLGVSSETARLLARMKTPTRVISKLPHKVLDAPGIKDDFYLNLMDWSSQNIVAVALGASVYCWYGATGKVSKLCDLDETREQVTSVTWSQRGNHLAVGLRSGGIQIWDITRSKHVRTLTGHTSRVGTLAWNSHVLASGSRDRSILLHDPRAASVGGSSSSRASTSTGSVVGKFLGHKQEVCGMKWSPDQQQLASGGNDNKLLIWSAHTAGAASAQGGAPLHRFDQHQAAVKAIAWSPHQHGLLCSGGGTADRCIRFWNTQLGQPISHIDTGSQVCNLLWSKNCNEIVSTHGYSLNQIIAWKYPTMQQITTLVGHTMRVLYLAVSPCGQTILTGAGDETLRFWNLFPNSESQTHTPHAAGGQARWHVPVWKRPCVCLLTLFPSLSCSLVLSPGKAGVGPSSTLVLPTTESLLR